MAMIKYALEKGQPKRLAISFEANWQNAKVLLDGEEVGAFSDSEHLRVGQTFTLADGSMLYVQLTGGRWSPVFKILKDGQPLATTGPSASERLKMTYKMLFLIAVVNLVGGTMGLLPNSSIPISFSAALFSLITGVVFVILGFFVMRKSLAALTIAVAIFVIGGITVLFNFRNLSGLGWLGVVLRLLVLFVFVQGFGAIQALKQEQAKAVDATI